MQHTAPDARVEMERQRDLHNRIVQEIADDYELVNPKRKVMM